jgi:hypothetical protein
MTAQTEQSATQVHEHAVLFYTDEHELIAAVGAQLAEALEHGFSAVVIAAGEHGAGFERELERLGTDADGRLVLLDASITLNRLKRGGRIDATAFRRVIGRTIRDAARGGRPVWAYGEMVALLWADGEVSSAIELEQLWNGLGTELEFSLLCAYPSSVTSDPQHRPAIAEVCRLHTSVVPPTPQPPREVAITGFRPSLDAPRRARQFVAEVVSEHGDAELIDDAVLIASELATNAVVHAGSRFEVAVHFDPETVTLSVSDSSAEPPVAGDPSPWDVSGRGLPVVAALALDWGCAETQTGKAVWAELARYQHVRYDRPSRARS